ncbi:glycerol-3-phosphate dehydrogenase [Novosphingobium humi]|uniref:Glycerol-3-phosphate dehydrogenase n=1 Tax=Novosphingobium humi TaxID=2282397 RepID=A0ABY7U208_9SPHN|nr:glycerol-3-phosphate dehydrogenase [Novosphingobium humi]WCT79548.1 glycerol-3-phosphate dehydrogenase [Novosphingobium humi]
MAQALPPLADYDLLVIGGGINGAGIARDAAGRGLKVLLVERDDLAAHTSSASTKLIHGGLRYLEYYEFRLVREALQERERLIHIAPHISWPLRFVLPQPKGGRPGWMIRIGLWLYDHIGGKQTLPPSHGIDLRDPRWGAGLKPGLAKGFVYSDAWVDDARLVVLNAIDAAERGATIRTGVTATGAKIEDDHWLIDLSSAQGAEQVRARAVVNAAGPWVGAMLGAIPQAQAHGGIRLVKGSHIIVRRVYPGDHAFILQKKDGRIVFTIPYQDGFTLVGTTDLLVGEAERDAPKISAEEVDYLCATVNDYFEGQIGPDDVVSTYSGVRPLYDDGGADAKAITRDYVLKLGRESGPQVLSIFGGKLTTYRRLAEHALEMLEPFLPSMRGGWTGTAPLPGGDFTGGFAAFLADVRRRWPFLSAELAARLAHAYGSRIERILDDAQSLGDLGEDFGHGLYEAELRYLADREWARTSADVLWRRSKLGLTAPPDMARRVDQWLEQNR